MNVNVKSSLGGILNDMDELSNDAKKYLELVEKALWMPHLLHSQMSFSQEPVGSV